MQTAAIAPVLCLRTYKVTWLQCTACDRLQQERQELEEERLRQFCTGMKAVNSRLGSVYQQLTAGKGDAYLSYTEDALLLFADGVGFHVRFVT